MLQAIQSPFLVPFDGAFRTKNAPTFSRDIPSDKQCKTLLKAVVKEIGDIQRMLYAHNYYALLLIFQAMDSAGKDSTIRAVLSGINPAGCQVYSFKKPSQEELDHDFLWRTTRCLPERGKIGVFNRSYYEEVLVVRVHPEYLMPQRLVNVDHINQVWQDRYHAIREQELHLAKAGTVIVKFWLNVSKEEQRLRFISRLDEPEKHWKFSESDLVERGYWDQYMSAYECALNETSRSWAPWYAIPADNKPYMRLCVAKIILATLKTLDLHYPVISETDKKQFKKLRKILEKN